MDCNGEIDEGVSEIFYIDEDEDADDDGWDFDRNFIIAGLEKFTNLEEYLNSTNPRDSDTDGDGMPDGWEAFYDFKVNDSVTVTPAIFVIEKDGKEEVNGALVKTTFNF